MLDPTENGWLAKYLESRLEIPFSDSVEGIDDEGKKLYAHLHNSGVLYGHPIQLPVDIEVGMSSWPIKERMKIIYAEAFIAAKLINNGDAIKGDAQLFGNDLLQYYQLFRPALAKKKLFSLGANSSGLSQSELIFNRRLKVKAQWNAGFWRGFFHNILLFIDLIHYVGWLNESSHNSSSWEDLWSVARWDALKLIAIAAKANNKVDGSEESLFEYFLESAEFNKKDREVASQLLKQDLNFSDLSINENDSWLKRKYYLELSILTLWADRSISKEEEEFIFRFNKYLGFDDTECESSLVSVQSFVMNNWERVHFLQEKQNFLMLRNTLTERMSKVAKKYTNQIKTEVLESKDLVALLSLSNDRELSTSEKDQVRLQLFDILKSIPAFIIFALPFSFLTIPVLMKIIPKTAFPSSFDPNRLNIKKRGNRTIDY